MVLRRIFGGLNASVESTDCILADWRHRHNIEAGTMNQTSKSSIGPLTPGQFTGSVSYEPKSNGRTALHLCTVLKLRMGFAQTKETFGISAIPIEDTTRYGFVSRMDIEDEAGPVPGPWVTPPKYTLETKRVNRYHFLARAQKTKYAVTPMHTDKEFMLFNKELGIGGKFFTLGSGQPNWHKIAQWCRTRQTEKPYFINCQSI
jgi:hypothetical protein